VDDILSGSLTTFAYVWHIINGIIGINEIKVNCIKTLKSMGIDEYA
jgi:hypothetical protein